MKKNFLFGMIAVLMTSSLALAASDLECSESQRPADASANIAALLSRGYLAAGHKYISDGGGIDGNNQMVTSEHMDIGNHLRLTHAQINRVDSYSLAVSGNANMTDQQVFEALLKVSDVAAKTLSADDGAALRNCDHLLGAYIGVTPQPDHP